MQEKVKQPLAEELLFGKLVHGGEVTVRLKDDALTFEITPSAPKKTKAARAKAPGKPAAPRARRKKDGVVEE
jgi:ATP-dependent Clp protease ATP-binding subunit ClpA